MYKKGYGIYVFTNQSKSWKKDMIVTCLTTLGIPLTVCIAFEKKDYKPNLTMFNEAFSKDQSKKLKIGMSLFVGDAMGRKNDHSDVDLKFAEAIGIKCVPPEDIFPGAQGKNVRVSPRKKQEIVVMVGYPGSGKSTVCETIFEKAGYYVAHGDVLKTSAKMIKEARSHVAKGESVVFDATNPSKDKRAEYVNFAREVNLPVRCVVMTTSMEESLARNNKRAKPVPRIVYNVYKKKYEEPVVDEGFEAIVLV
jgi:bifunctional polynucleotide phosphatase/kinase